MSYTVIIPARYQSTRLPEKVLLDLNGKPMLQHVWERAQQCAAARVVIATDHQLVEAACKDFGAEVFMTSEDHSSGTDRLQEVTNLLGLADDEIVVNVQGDEPLIPPAVIDQVARNLAANAAAGIATLAEAITDAAVLDDPNAVKLVTADNGMALYFSRAAIPWDREGRRNGSAAVPGMARRHIGIYAYRVSFLNQYVSWSPARLEQIEMLEQLRAMAHGIPIHVADACEPVPAGVDTLADLEALRALVAGKG